LVLHFGLAQKNAGLGLAFYSSGIIVVQFVDIEEK
jgi:hypothetical protein